MRSFVIRNLKVFFRDKSAVFFSLLSVFIIVGLYALFLGNVWSAGFKQIANVRFVMDSWMMAGLLTVTTVTATMGAFGIKVDDETKKISKDFHSSPIKPSMITLGYILSAFIIAVVMSVVALLVIEAYVVLSGGSLLSFAALIKVLLLILLSSFTNTAMLFLIASFFRSQNAFTTASTIIGTIIGFITGIYVPIGSLPSSVQLVIKVFPTSHAAALFRQVIMEAPLSSGFAGAPEAARLAFEKTMGVTLFWGEKAIPVFVSVAVLLIAATVFCALAAWKMSQKKR